MTPEQFVQKWSQIQQKETAVLDTYDWPPPSATKKSWNTPALNLERAAT